MKKYSSVFIVLLILSSILILNQIQTFNQPSTPTQIDQDLSSHPIYSKYEFSSDPNVINMGIQPLWVPTSIITEVMSHDQILSNQLEQLGFSIAFYPFLKGNDLNYFMKKDALDIGVGGDMPAIRLVSNDGVEIVSLIQEGPISIISKNVQEIQDLRNKKIGYAFGSNAHYYLVNTLLTNGVSLDSVQLISMDIIEMTPALANGEIDAFAAWEPTPTLALESNSDFIVTHQGRSLGFIYIKEKLIEENLDVVYQVLAAEIRAIHWLKASDHNIAKAIFWANEESLKLQPNATLIDPEVMLELVKQDLPGKLIKEYPRINHELVMDEGFLETEYLLLKSLGLVPDDSDWSDIVSSINLEILETVISSPGEYQLFGVSLIEDG